MMATALTVFIPYRKLLIQVYLFIKHYRFLTRSDRQNLSSDVNEMNKHNTKKETQYFVPVCLTTLHSLFLLLLLLLMCISVEIDKKEKLRK